ncbi:16S rRNA (cytidine(1402)-2'-O)-methyltransferase [Hellea sp.]|nr:16S rRNA (cytidine(1402)-2'-O)-methyltransferase [Hellea sp.]
MTHSDSISDTNPSQHLTGEELQSNSVKNVTLESGLYVVATPIGNLRDITLRALDTLRAADMILAEDTRQTHKLLSAYDIKTPLSPYHDHNAAKRVPGVIKDLQAGKVVALVSDAGTPLVSDPGFNLVRAAVKAGIDVFPLPGPSAVLAGLVKSGLPSDRFMFAGFLPPKSGARKTSLEALTNVKATLIFFETGPRIAACLTDMHSVFGERDVVLTRELTKHYEEARHGDFETLMKSVKADKPRGELVVLVGPPSTSERWGEEDVISALNTQIPELGVKRASAEISAQCGWPKRDVYQLALKLK